MTALVTKLASEFCSGMRIIYKTDFTEISNFQFNSAKVSYLTLFSYARN